jgi:hypothetical protein
MSTSIDVTPAGTVVDHAPAVGNDSVVTGYDAAGYARTRFPEAILNVSPVVTAFAVIVPDHRNVPPDDAVHIEKCV